jgi:hypothetical protein
MKTKLLITVALLASGLLPVSKANAQIEIIGEVVKAAIMAVDLGVQKIQTQTIFLQDAQKELENAMQATHLSDITNWVQQQKDLYSEYYQELWQIKDALALYSKVKNIIEKQVKLISYYKKAYAAVQQDSHFNTGEVSHIVAVYNSILNSSVQNVNTLTLIINAFVTQMGDGDRLELINTLDGRIDQNYYELQAFTQENVLLSLQRSKDETDFITIKSLYGIQ